MLTVLVTYWWVFAMVVLYVAYVLLHKSAAKKAVVIVEDYLKTVEAAAFAKGNAALPALADVIYSKLPKMVKAFLPRGVFDLIVKEAFGKAKAAVDAAK